MDRQDGPDHVDGVAVSLESANVGSVAYMGRLQRRMVVPCKTVHELPKQDYHYVKPKQPRVQKSPPRLLVGGP